ncbi:MAG: DUF1080 domain-containing protein [Bacteroidota bacterium]|nr:DUF1080 domain-containing protein [Bacteroidota bacterium]
MGSEKWEPRLEEPRDVGIMYHCTGKNVEGLWHVFMMGLENQISESTSGDLFLVPNYDYTIWPIGKARIDPEGKWDPTASLVDVGGDQQGVRQQRSKNYESKKDEWTTMEVYTLGTSAIHLVNGNVVMVVENTGIKYPDETTVPLSKGKIQLQSEGAEAYYRRATIQKITEIPAEIKAAAGL